uniref:Uncharacterized protein n=2 Tax=Rhodnius prolixus TaxID=13249 RepID=T1HVP9_RHOPR
MLLVLEVLLLIATISFIATLCTALISGWELTLLLLLAIPVKIIVQRKQEEYHLRTVQAVNKEGSFSQDGGTKYLLPPF